jgi:uncharacterized protein YdbL (DUF1318 family)
MNLLRIPLSLLLLLVATACVTINVYFPAEAAERAADRIIRDVYGEDTDTKAEPAGPQSWNHYPPAVASPGLAWLDWLITPAHAEADISVNTPAIRKLEASMEARHRKLSPYYASGAVGMTGDGQISIHNQKQIPLQERNSVKTLVSQENRDRSALYAEIARANGHPEWESDIRQTFARRWVGNAPRGWWYKDAGGNWKQK